jgi:hypothetical protein
MALCTSVAVAAGVTISLLVSSGSTWILVGAGLLVALVPVVPLLFGRRFDVFEPAYLFAVSYLVLFVIRPVFDLTQSAVPSIAGENPRSGYDLALAIALAGALAFFVGYYAALGRSVARHIGHLSDELDRTALSAFTIVSLIAGLGLYAAFIAISGGLPALLSILSGRNETTVDLVNQPLGYLYSGILWLAAVGILLLASASRWRTRQGAVAAFLLVISQITTLPTGDRSWVLPVAGAVVILFYLRYRATTA